jgi:hypothetical protein
LCARIFTRIAACAAEERVETSEGSGYAWWRKVKNKGKFSENSLLGLIVRQ